MLALLSPPAPPDCGPGLVLYTPIGRQTSGIGRDFAAAIADTRGDSAPPRPRQAMLSLPLVVDRNARSAGTLQALSVRIAYLVQLVAGD